ncbi:hypothetical protein WICPIJ_005894 [Wickerhamomyces pijperi]|uniref:Uncharacterized protein n=1 Tax=Wickerhamomyces pijperi TaxID=599730 RepID=A0A9P8TLX6_WICPI|nr:hypothetical protein WICPIJ_005894 [Wickerhamomyces pijperi]
MESFLPLLSFPPPFKVLNRLLAEGEKDIIDFLRSFNDERALTDLDGVCVACVWMDSVSVPCVVMEAASESA